MKHLVLKATPGWLNLLALTVSGVVLGSVAVNWRLSLVLVGLGAIILASLFLPRAILLALWPVSLVLWYPLVQVSGYNVTLTDVLTLILWVQVLFLSGNVKNTGSGARLTQSLFLIALLPIIPLALAGTLADGLHGAVVSVALFAKRWAIYSILPMAISRSQGRRQIFEGALVLASSIAMLIGILSTDPAARASGLLFNPNVLGLFSTIGLNVAVGLAIRSHGTVRALLAAVVVLHVLALALSGSREAWIGLAVSVAYWMFATKRRWVMVAVAITAIIVLVTPAGDISRQRIGRVWAEGASESNVAGRLDAAQVSLRLLADHPLGVGAGNIGVVGRDYLARYGNGNYGFFVLNEGFTTSDNEYLDTLMEGSILSLIFLGLALRYMWSVATAPQARAVLVALITSGLAASVLHVPFITGALWFVVGTGSKEPSSTQDGRNVKFGADGASQNLACNLL